jgi:NADH:ubiquinone oxidoreductase subunit 5 (subunit L)/multisubunit Na+/H+ antiporter MnhA subunit
MPVTSAALTVGLIGLSALPPGLGFATLWLLFEAILSSPRTGGLLFQLPLALIGAALAFSTALTTAASTRLVGIALLGRPRTPRGAGAREDTSACRIIMLALAALSVISGVLPGAVLWLLADPAIRVLTDVPPGARVGWALLVPSTSSPSYLALPVLAILTLATGAAILLPRWLRKESKPVGPWTGGMKPPVGLPFGEPGAQSIGEGFVPALPALRMPRIPVLALPTALSAKQGIWLLIAASGLVLAVLALTG